MILDEAVLAVAEVAVPVDGGVGGDGPAVELPSARLARLADDAAAAVIAIPTNEWSGVDA